METRDGQNRVPTQLWPGGGEVSWLEGLPTSMATSIVRFRVPSPDPHLQLDPRQGPAWGLASSSSPLGVPESKYKVRHKDAE